MLALDIGPWEVAGYEVRIAFEPGVRLVAARGGVALRTLPAAVRESVEMAWIRLALEAALTHRRALRDLLETAMVEQMPLSDQDLAALALDPAGRPMLAALLMEVKDVVGWPLPEEWTLLPLVGESLPLAAPARVPHPVALDRAGTLPEWGRRLNTRGLRQPFKQLRREFYLPDPSDLRHEVFSDRFAGARVRWDQARALLEGRGWQRVTKMGAEKRHSSAGLTATAEFSPYGRGPREIVTLRRVYFLPTGERPRSQARPGLPLVRVPPILFSETLRDVGLVAEVAGR